MRQTIFLTLALAAICMSTDAQNLKTKVNGATVEMIEVKGGTFDMGDRSGLIAAATPVHKVMLDTYYIGRTEVTQQLWTAVMGYNNSQFKGEYRPVETIDYSEILTFILKLNRLTGLTFRLPTEAEWEYAARGGIKSKGYKYSGSDNLDDVGWNFYNNVNNATHNVANKAPNELGIYDMTGNVWEWCSDYNGEYTQEPQKNPSGPTRQTWHQARGGAFHNNTVASELCYRDRSYPSKKNFTLGFRLAMDATKENMRKMKRAATWDLTEAIVAEPTLKTDAAKNAVIENPTFKDIVGAWQYISLDEYGRRKYHMMLKFFNADGTFQNYQFSQNGNGKMVYEASGAWSVKDGCLVQRFDKRGNSDYLSGNTVTIKLTLDENGKLMNLIWMNPLHGGKTSEWFERID